MDLFAEIVPFASGMLPVGDGHSLYWEQSGNPAGVPAIFLHGGPGAGTQPAYRRFFDPTHYRIILFDQRGAGRSTPYASVEHNTTDHLVGDLEAIRLHLKVDRWLIFGGSWGSTLALAYGQAHPQRCLGFVLRGVFLFSRDEVEWFMRQMGRFFPEARHAFLAHLSAEERGDALGSYYRRLTDTDPAVHMAAAAAWCAYEEACSRLIPPNLPLYEGRPTMSNLAMARIEAHYMVHAGFLAENQLLDKMTLLRNHPAAIIQGRYDVICPIMTADSLVRAWPGANYRVVPDAGHSAMEPGIRSALVAATQQFRAIKL